MADRTGVAALQQNVSGALDWLFVQAMPLWSDVGIDHAGGGFVERLDPEGKVLDEPRRTRLVARQIYAFATASRLGWKGPADEAVRHGLSFFHNLCVSKHGGVHASVMPDGTVLNGGFDLYDHAFALFGLAAAARMDQDADQASQSAHALMDHIERGWRHPKAGFEEARPRSLPLKANPHMHMLEASLVWAEVEPGGRWDRLADEIVELCLSAFLNPDTGALHEFFDGDWRPYTTRPGDVVEPGHQFEWAWLLVRWARLRDRPDALTAARRLHELATLHGVDPVRDLAINELNGDLSVRDDRARLWPQTERIKSLLALATVAKDDATRGVLTHQAATAVGNLARYYTHPVQGAWWEHIDAASQPMPEPTRASSLYHIVCALAEARDFVENQVAGLPSVISLSATS